MMLSVCNSINTNAKTPTVSVSNLSPLAVAYLKSLYLHHESGYTPEI